MASSVLGCRENTGCSGRDVDAEESGTAVPGRGQCQTHVDDDEVVSGRGGPLWGLALQRESSLDGALKDEGEGASWQGASRLGRTFQKVLQVQYYEIIKHPNTF